jgi:hypothetical protein
LTPEGTRELGGEAEDREHGDDRDGKDQTGLMGEALRAAWRPRTGSFPRRCDVCSPGGVSVR